MLRKLLWQTRLTQFRTAPYFRDLERFTEIPPDEARREIGMRLMSQLTYFGARQDALPEWREALPLRDTEDIWRIWTSLPIMTKSDLRNRFHPDEITARTGVQGRVSATGGSTGEPTPFLHDAAMVRASVATQTFSQLQMGWRPGMPTICLWGSERDIGKSLRLRSRFLSYLLNWWIIDGYNLDEDTVARVLDVIRRRSPVALYGFSSMLEFVARQVVESGMPSVRGSVVAAWNGGEMLFDSQSELFKNAFGTPIMNYYGGRELSAMAYQPAEGAALRVLRPLVFVEVVDSNGAPVEPGEIGRLIWTSTVCRGTPFIRYDSGDLGCYEESDRDESGVISIKELHGRQAGLLTLPNGKTISCLFWNHLFKEYPEVEQFQVVLLHDNGIALRLKGRGITKFREKELRSTLEGFLGPLPVEIAWVDRITLTSQGKLVQVLREPTSDGAQPIGAMSPGERVQTASS